MFHWLKYFQHLINKIKNYLWKISYVYCVSISLSLLYIFLIVTYRQNNPKPSICFEYSKISSIILGKHNFLYFIYKYFKL